jgi:hypothetical protein
MFYVKKYLNRFLVLVGSLILTSNAYALDVQIFRPTQTLSGGTELHTSKTEEAHQFSIGYSLNWTRNPLEVGQIDDDPRQGGLVEDFVTSNFAFGYYFTNDFGVFVNIPFNFHHNVNAVPGIFNEEDDFGPDMGDVQFSAKYSFKNPENSEKGWGFSVIPFVIAPSGEEHLFFGNENVAGGFIFAADKIWGENHLYINLGTQFREKERIANLDVHHELLMGIGFERPLIKKWRTKMNIEFEGSTTYREFFSEEITSPFNLHFNVKKAFLEKNNLQWNIGMTLGATNGYGSPDFRILTGLVYQFPIHSDGSNKTKELDSEN